jgi:hypothetical protein
MRPPGARQQRLVAWMRQAPTCVRVGGPAMGYTLAVCLVLTWWRARPDPVQQGRSLETSSRVARRNHDVGTFEAAADVCPVPTAPPPTPTPMTTTWRSPRTTPPPHPPTTTWPSPRTMPSDAPSVPEEFADVRLNSKLRSWFWSLRQRGSKFRGWTSLAHRLISSAMVSEF